MSRVLRAVAASTADDGGGAEDGGAGIVAERLRRHGHTLSRAERTVAEYLATVSAEELPFLGAARIAEATGTSDATVVRAARSLGFSGLPELKRVAARPRRLTTTRAERIAAQTAVLGDDAQTVAEAFHGALRELVDDNAQQVDAAELERARRVVAAGRTVWAIGIGTSGVAAQHLADRLTRSGHAARWTHAAGFDLASDLLAVQPEDVIVLIHGASPSRDFDDIVAWAREAGVPVVLVTGTQLADRHRAEVAAVIACVGTASQLVRWTLAALHAVELLALLVASADPDRAVAANRRLGDIRRALGSASRT